MQWIKWTILAAASCLPALALAEEPANKPENSNPRAVRVEVPVADRDQQDPRTALFEVKTKCEVTVTEALAGRAAAGPATASPVVASAAAAVSATRVLVRSHLLVLLSGLSPIAGLPLPNDRGNLVPPVTSVAAFGDQ